MKMKTFIFFFVMSLLMIADISTAQEVEIYPDSLTIVDGAQTERVQLFLKASKAGIVVSNAQGQSVAQMITSADGNAGVIALDNDNQVPSIIMTGGSETLGLKTGIQLTGDSAIVAMKNTSYMDRVRIFHNGTKSGLVLSNPTGESVAQITTSPTGDSGILALDNDAQEPTIFMQGGSTMAGTIPEIRISGDSSKMSMRNISGNEKSKLFVRGNKSGLVLMNPVGESVAQLITSPDGMYGLLAIENDQQVPSILVTGGTTSNSINPSLTFTGKDTDLNFMSSQSAMSPRISLRMLQGYPSLLMFTPSGQPLVQLGTTVGSTFGDLRLWHNNNDQNRIFFDARYSSQVDKSILTLYNGYIELNKDGNNYSKLGGDLSGGTLEIFQNSNGIKRLEINTGTTGKSGVIRMLGDNQQENILSSTTIVSENLGYLGIYNEDPLIKVGMYATLEGNGEIEIWGDNGFNNIYLANSGADANRGYLHVANSSGAGRAGALITSDQKGLVFSENFQLLDASNAVVASMSINGSGNSEVSAHTISATVKNFKIDHPSQQGKEIWFACIEGPEVAAYARGTATLLNGEATILLPDYFSEIVESEGITLTITPLSAQSMGIAVISKGIAQFSVKELFEGRGNYHFDWEIKAVRSGFRNYEVVRTKSEKNKTKPEKLKDLISDAKSRTYNQRN